MRECLSCHFILADEIPICPKCGADVGRQSDGSTRVVDLGHRGMTVDEAVRQLRQILADSPRHDHQHLLVITGRGRIRDAVDAVLGIARRDNIIVSYTRQAHNPGAFAVRIKP